MTTKYLHIVTLLAAITILPGCPAFRPLANFTLEPGSGTAPLEVGFTNHSRSGAGQRLRYRWDFGDGSPPSDVEAPTHVYESPGVYDVSLTAFSVFGRDTMTRGGAVRVTGPGPNVIADFDANARMGYAPLTVSFTDKTTSSHATITGWHWQFGDGATSNEQYPQHRYHTPGVYTVSLNVDTDAGQFKSVKANYITVESPDRLLAAQRALVPDAPVSPGDYVYVNVVVTSTQAVSPTSLTLREMLPASWNFVDVLASGEVPDQIQVNSVDNAVTFAWLDIPPFPLQFTYRMLAPSGCEETSLLTGKLNFHLGGPAFSTPLEDSPLQCIKLVEGEENYTSLYLSRSDATGNYAYVPEQELEITIRLEKFGATSPAGIHITEQLPANWTFAGLRDGVLPDLFPSPGATGELVFAWMSDAPTPPFSFTYAVTPPNTAANALFNGWAQYSIGGAALLSNEAQTYFRRFDTLIAIDRTVGAYAYIPGGVLDVTIRYASYGTEQPLAFGLVETLPQGWMYHGIVNHSGPAPEIMPAGSASRNLAFAWIDPPPMPGSFTYRVRIPDTAADQAQFSGYGLYRFTGPEQKTARSEITIPLSLP